MRITGLDKITKQMDALQKAMAALDGIIGKVSFNPSDPASIESAISQVNQMIDERLGSEGGNAMVASIAEQIKDRYRQGIIEKAAEARLKGSTDDD